MLRYRLSRHSVSPFRQSNSLKALLPNRTFVTNTRPIAWQPHRLHPPFEPIEVAFMAHEASGLHVQLNREKQNKGAHRTYT